MKIRNGFVSNSSSSSFLVIGTDNTSLIDELAQADHFDDSSGGYGVAGEGDELVYYGMQYDGHFDYGYAGVEAADLLERMTLPQARIFVQEIFLKLGVEVDVEDIDLYYGEMSSE